MRILVVDDDLINQKLLDPILTDFGIVDISNKS